jgi:hypothetical protein
MQRVLTEPLHGDRSVVPDGQNENHAALERLAHDLQTAELGEGVRVAERGLLCSAGLVRDRVVRSQARDGAERVVVDDAVLDVLAADLDKVATGGAVRRDELRDRGDRLGGVDGETRAGPEERLVPHAPRVEVAAGSVADTTVGAGSATAGSAVGASETDTGARVRGERLGERVGLPDVHLRAAGAELALARVGGGGVPAGGVGETTDELSMDCQRSSNKSCSKNLTLRSRGHCESQ